MNKRWLVGVLAGLMTLALACKGNPLEAERKAAEAAGTKAVETEVVKAGEVAAVAPVESETAKVAAVEAKAEGETEEAAPTNEGEAISDSAKTQLAECYTEVYCAQKKGQVDRILDVYKKYGFETPQSFTDTWVKAARDTDWVTKIAHDVGKKCTP